MPASESIFAKYLDPEKGPPEVDPANELLQWLVYRWARPTVTVRNICQFGPRAIRDRESALNLAEALVRLGKLIPVQTHRADKREWCIIREPIK
jgi:hypothetical protein